MEWIGRASRGEERLWVVFWIYGILLGILLQFGEGLLILAFPPIGFIAACVIAFIYTVWILISQWRCAFNADWRFWSYVVRTLVALSTISLVLGVMGVAVVLFYTGSLEALSQKWSSVTTTTQTIRIEPAHPAPPRIDGGQSLVEYKQLCMDELAQTTPRNDTPSKKYLADNNAKIEQCIENHIAKALQKNQSQ